MRRQTKPAVAPVYADEITALVRSNLTPGAVGKRLLDYHANDIATALENMSAVDRKRLFLALTPEALSDVFAYMDDMALAAAYLDELGEDYAKLAGLTAEEDRCLRASKSACRG